VKQDTKDTLHKASKKQSRIRAWYAFFGWWLVQRSAAY